MKHKISILTAILLLAVLWVLPIGAPLKLALSGGVILVWIMLTACGSYAISADWYFRSLHRSKEDSVALTFDDGPDPKTTERILSVLAENNVRATFFLIGEKAERYPELVKKIMVEGHTIGNHSFSHSKKIGFFPTAKLREDLQRCNDVLSAITGNPVKLFRPPFGVTNPRYERVLRQLNLTSVGWSLRSYDTVISSSEKLQQRLIGKLRPGQIILLHDTVPATADVLPQLIDHCRERQIGFMTIDSLLI